MITWTYCPRCMNHQDHRLDTTGKWRCDRCQSVNLNLRVRRYVEQRKKDILEEYNDKPRSSSKNAE